MAPSDQLLEGADELLGHEEGYGRRRLGLQDDVRRGVTANVKQHLLVAACGWQRCCPEQAAGPMVQQQLQLEQAESHRH